MGSIILPIVLPVFAANETFSLVKIIASPLYPHGVEGLALDGQGRLYIPDGANHRVLRIASDGGIDWTFGSLQSNMNLPLGINIDKNGSFYVTDDASKCVNKYASNGMEVGRPWCTYGRNGDFKIMRPASVASSIDGSVYVVDNEANRIIKYTSDGSYVLDWGGMGSQNGQFDSPWGIAAGQNGNVYVVDSLNNRVQVFTSDGTFVRSWGTAGSGAGQLSRPLGIWVASIDSQEFVYVSEYDNHRVQKFQSDGTFVSGWGSFCALTGTLYQVGSGCKDPDGSGPLRSGDGQFQHPYAVTADSSGLIYVADTYNDRIEVFSNNIATTHSLPSPERGILTHRIDLASFLTIDENVAQMPHNHGQNASPDIWVIVSAVAAVVGLLIPFIIRRLDSEKKKHTEKSAKLQPVTPGSDVPPIENKENEGESPVPREDKYLIKEEIGSGSFGVVYLATERSGNSIHQGRKVALKVARLSLEEDVEEITAGFMNEAKIWNSLRSDSIVKVYAFGKSPSPWIASEYMEGGTLRGLLNREGKMDIDRAIEIAVKLLGGLMEAESNGIIHRDIKPSNILFDDRMQPKLADWGLAKVLYDPEGPLTSSGIFKGTPAYAAPEQFDPDKYGGPDNQTDIYQLGVVLYEMVTGRLPFGRGYSEVRNKILAVSLTLPNVDSGIPELDSIISKALARTREERYRRAVELKTDLLKLGKVA